MIINIPIICAIIAILACLYAGYSDIKKGIIQNKLTFPLIIVGLVLNGIYAFMLGSPVFIITTFLYTVLIFIFGYIFWKLGAWAGGDVKLFTGLAALLPFPVTFFNYKIMNVQFPVFATYPFPLTLIINSILSIFPFLLIFVFYVVVKTKPYLLDELLAPLKNYSKNVVLALVITSAVTITYTVIRFIHLPMWQLLIVSFILLYLLSFIISKLPGRIKAIVVTAVTVFALYSRPKATLIAVILLFISLSLFGVIRSLLTKVSREALQDDYRIEELKEGMIPAYNLYERNGEVYVDDKSFFSRFREAAKTGNILELTMPKGKLLIGTMAAGLTEENIKLLKSLLNENKIEDSFRVKRGVPFAPAIFIGLLISIFIGDLAFIVEKILYIIIY